MFANFDVVKNVKIQYYLVLYIDIENKKRTIDIIIVKNI